MLPYAVCIYYPFVKLRNILDVLTTVTQQLHSFPETMIPLHTMVRLMKPTAVGFISLTTVTAGMDSCLYSCSRGGKGSNSVLTVKCFNLLDPGRCGSTYNFHILYTEELLGHSPSNCSHLNAIEPH